MSRIYTLLENLAERLNFLGIGNTTYNDCDTNNMLLVSRKYVGGTQRVHTDATNLTNAPSAWTSGTVIAYRQVMLQYESNLSHAVVLLYEVYPVNNRMWINVYNTSWTGWRVLNYTTINQHYDVTGTLLTETSSGSTSLRGYGHAEMMQLPSGLYQIDFNIKVTTSASSSEGVSNFNYCVCPISLFSAKVGKTLTPATLGTWRLYKQGTSSTLYELDANHYGYATFMQAYSSYGWRPARYYNTSGSVGVWHSGIFSVNDIFEGTCYASLG